MTEKDLTIQNLRNENEALRAELEWTGKEIMRLRNQLKMQWIPCSEKLPEEWIDDDDNTYINYLIYMPYFKAASGRRSKSESLDAAAGCAERGKR